MEKLRKVIEQHGRWNILSEYINRIETFVDSDFSLAFENSKAMLESIGKEICKLNGINLEDKSTMNGVLKNATKALGFTDKDFEMNVSASLGTIGQHLGNLRNEIGTTSHGKTLDEIQDRNNRVNSLTKEFLLDSIEILSCFLIRIFENKLEIPQFGKQEDVDYYENDTFNDYWDDIYGEFEMNDYSFSASEILYNVDKDAYINEYKSYTDYIAQEIQEDEI